jgi:tetratricopeptide (TPR) repeat protein
VSAANAYALRGDFDQALTRYETAGKLFGASRDRDGQGMALLGLAQAFQSLERCDAAEAAYQEAQRCFQDCGARRRECQVVYAWGNLCREQARFERAMELYARGVFLAEAEGDQGRRAEGHRRIGDAWADQGNVSDAIVSYQTSLDIANGAGNAAEQRQTWSSLGRLYATLRRPFDAITCFEDALALVDEETYPEEEVALLFHLAEARLDAGQRNEALETWSRAVVIAETVADPTVAAMAGLSRATR